MALISGVFDPTMDLPSWPSRAAELLPVKALTDALRHTYDPAASGMPLANLLILASWAVLGTAVAGRCFRWQTN